MFRKHGFSGGRFGWLAALRSSWPGFSLLLRLFGAAGILSSQEKLLARPFPSFCSRLFPFLRCGMATKTGAQQSVRNDVMLAGTEMGGRASWPYLVPPVCPGPLTLTLHVTSGNADRKRLLTFHRGRSCIQIYSHRTSRTKLSKRVLEALKQVDSVVRLLLLVLLKL